MKKRYAGGFAAVVFALGFLLSQFWNFGGFGTGETEQSGTADSESTSDADVKADFSNVSANGNLQTSVIDTSTANIGGDEKFVTVAIHEDRFRLTTMDDPQSGVDVPLNELVKRVKEAQGGEQGIKLRILFQKNAQEGTLADLYTALAAANINREEIQEISEYID